MIILYDKNLFEIGFAQLGTDATTIAFLNSTKAANQAVFTTADDANVVSNNSLYYVGENGGGSPTGVNAKDVISVTSSSTTDMLNESPTITVQIKNQAGGSVAVSGVSVTLAANNGLFSSYTVTTNNSGSATATFFPTKQLTAFINAESPLYIGGSTVIVFDAPTTATEQNWLETNDIRPNAITGDKIMDGTISGEKISSTVKTRTIVPTSWTDIQRARVISKYDLGWDDFPAAGAMIAGDTYLYVYGANIATSFHELKQVNKLTGVVAATYTFGVALTGWFGLTYDGTYVYVGAIDGVTTNVYKIDAVAMTLTDTFPITSAVTSLIWDGRYLYGHGTDNNMYRMTIDGGDMEQVTTSGILQPCADGLRSWAMTKDAIYSVSANTGIGVYVKKSRNTYNIATSDIDAGLGASSAYDDIITDGIKLWFGTNSSTVSIVETNVWNPDSEATPTSTATLIDGDKQIGLVRECLAHDGINLWMGSCESQHSYSGTSRVFLRKIGRDPADATKLVVKQSIPLSLNSITIQALLVEGQNIWVSNIDGTELVELRYQNSLFEDFEDYSTDATGGANKLTNSENWVLGAGDDNCFINQSATALAGYKSLAIYGPTTNNYSEAVITFDNRTDEFITRFIYEVTADAYSYSDNKPVFVFPASDSSASYPWLLSIHKDNIEITDASGTTALAFDPGTVLHEFEVDTTAAGSITVLIDTSGYYTNATGVIPLGDPAVNKIVVGHAADSLTAGNLVGYIDQIGVYRGASGTWDVAKIFIGG